MFTNAISIFFSKLFTICTASFTLIIVNYSLWGGKYNGNDNVSIYRH